MPYRLATPQYLYCDIISHRGRECQYPKGKIKSSFLTTTAKKSPRKIAAKNRCKKLLRKTVAKFAAKNIEWFFGQFQKTSLHFAQNQLKYNYRDTNKKGRASNMKKTAYTPEQIKMLNLLSKQYPSIQTAGAAVVNLNAILNLPKGTEHFLSDLHGEAEAFKHILNNCSGVIREKVDNLFYRFVSESERRELCTLIYYPAEKIEELHAKGEDTSEWYDLTLYRLVDLARSVASKYTRSKVRDALPFEYQNIIDELLHTSGEEHNKQEYYRNIISTIIENIFIIQRFYIFQCKIKSYI